ncbi:E3 ubiquitin- ligase DTX3L-like [Paramuricea clavata]|nr:E3 ubiquitin- ligase DTX3L-like [Paramuricea clavata]
MNDKMYCNQHSGKKLKVYCETCDQLICRDCMDFKHVKQGHSCVLVKDVANNYKELLASNGKAMEDALTEGNVFLQRLTLTAEQLDRDAENAKNKIAQRKAFVAKKVIEMLDQKAETLLKKVDEIQKGKRASLDRQAEESKLYVENIKTSVQLSKKLVDQGSEVEIISSQKMMLDNANNLLTKREEYFKAPIPVAKLSYTSSTGKEPINEEILRALANSLGEVNEGNKDEDQSKNTDQKAGSRDDKCPLCLCDFADKKTLSKCGHSFCAGCIDETFKHQKKCPVCSQVYGPLIGNQPYGRMYDSHRATSLPGFGLWDTIVITYSFPNGTQGPDHLNPGKPYTRTNKTAYLPRNKEGKKVLKLLKKAFDQKLIFTIARSTTTGRDDCVVWNDIPHKTSTMGGPAKCGYPDPDYLRRVQETLAAKGITE